MNRSGPAAHNQGEIPRITAPTDRNLPDGVGHVPGNDLYYASRSVFWSSSSRHGKMLPQRAFSEVQVDPETAAQECRPIQTAKQCVCIGNCWFTPSSTVAGGARISFGTFWPDAKQP